MRRMYSEKQIRELVKTTKGYDIVNLVDKDGHERFIEGDIPDPEITGLTPIYYKWSLSGTHLMIVMAGTIENGTNLSNYILNYYIMIYIS